MNKLGSVAGQEHPTSKRETDSEVWIEIYLLQKLDYRRNASESVREVLQCNILSSYFWCRDQDL